MSQRSRSHRPSLIPGGAASAAVPSPAGSATTAPSASAAAAASVASAAASTAATLSEPLAVVCLDGSTQRRGSALPHGGVTRNNVTLRTHLRDPGPARCFGFLGTIAGICLLAVGIIVTSVASMLRAHKGLPKVDANIIQYTFICLVGFFITISSSILYSSANKVKRTMEAESQALADQKDAGAPVAGQSGSHSNEGCQNPQIVITHGENEGRTPGAESTVTILQSGLSNSVSNTASDLVRCSSLASTGSGSVRGGGGTGGHRRGSGASGGQRRSSRSPRASPGRSPRPSPHSSPTLGRRNSSRRRRSNATTSSATTTTTTTTDGSDISCSGVSGVVGGRRLTPSTRPDLTVPDPEEFLGSNFSRSPPSGRPTPSLSLPSYDAALGFPAPARSRSRSPVATASSSAAAAAASSTASTVASAPRGLIERRRSDGCRHRECRRRNAGVESPPPPSYEVAVRNSHQIIESGAPSPLAPTFPRDDNGRLHLRVAPPSPGRAHRPSTPIPPSLSLPSISSSSAADSPSPSSSTNRAPSVSANRSPRSPSNVGEVSTNQNRRSASVRNPTNRRSSHSTNRTSRLTSSRSDASNQSSTDVKKAFGS